MDTRINLCIVRPAPSISETFIRAHAEHLPAKITMMYSHYGGPRLGDEPALSQSLASRGYRKICRMLTGRPGEWEMTSGYLKAFKKCRIQAVLAEYGPQGVQVTEACRIANIPLTVHFHGFDASMHLVLRKFREGYLKMFHNAAAIIAVSKAMKNKLISLGAPGEKVFYNPYGVDTEVFNPGRPEDSEAQFLSVGRFTEKKAPHLTLLAFAKVRESCPGARLRMIGDGPLLGLCRDMAQVLGIDDAVTFLGAQPHEVVRGEMQKARAFIQHSMEAADGDCEGTPVAVLEAGASALPVVATRHAGIPDVVVEGVTGLLVDERDVPGMVSHMICLANDPALAARLGGAARERIEHEFSMEGSIAGLWAIIESSVSKRTKS